MVFEEYGITPIDTASPAGADIRYLPEMDALSAEMDKLQNPAASVAVDWDKVIQLSGNILSGKSKDLLVACYLAVALMQKAGVSGLDQGIALLKSMTEHFWEGMFPSIQRIRGRKQAIQWWADRASNWLQNNPPADQQRELVERLVGNLDALDAFLGGAMEDPPYLLELKQCVGMIPVQAEPEAPMQDVAAESQQETRKETPFETPQALPDAGTTGLRPTGGSPPAPVPTVQPARDISNVEISDADSAYRLLDQALEAIRSVANYLRQVDLFDPDAIRLVRLIVAAKISKKPSASDGITKVPPPPDDLRGSLEQLQENGNWNKLLDKSEYYLPIYPFWIDLSLYSATALDQLGNHDLTELATHLASDYTGRLNGIEELAFRDGTPFVSEETKYWLRQRTEVPEMLSQSEETADWLHQEARVPEPRPQPEEKATYSEAVDSGDAMKATIEHDMQKATEERYAGSLQQALRFLEKQLESSASAKESAMRRAALVSFLVEANENRVAVPYAERLLEEIDRFRVDEWDPEVSVEVLADAYRAFRSIQDPVCMDKAEHVMARIAGISPARAIALDS
jgi:type VI secretion system protein VasJ